MHAWEPHEVYPEYVMFYCAEGGEPPDCAIQ